MKKKRKNDWPEIFITVLIAMQILVFAVFRKDSYIAVHDNLDLFVAQLQMMKNTHSFFSHDITIPMLGGISRDTLGSQFSLYNILYFIFPSFTAYMIGYFLKIIIGLFSVQLLAKEVYGNKYDMYRPLFLVTGLAYGLIPVFPAYGIAFTSIPLLVYLMIKIVKEPKTVWYICLFLYPLLSYFSYFGFFILAYMVCMIIYLWIKEKKIPKSSIGALIVLAAGYVVFEYRLFHEMLFTNVETIRSIMKSSSLGFSGIIGKMIEPFFNPVFHAQDSHVYFLLPVVLTGLVCINFSYIRKKQFHRIGKEPGNWIFLFILFNCVVAGLYHCEGFRTLIETLLPPLEGFQFDRTVYFNPFLWFALLFCICKHLYDCKKAGAKEIANGIVVIAALVVMFFPQTYNDFYATCSGHAYEILKEEKPDSLSYREFYSEDLFEKAKKDIDYQGEWSVAYGFHPAVLEYNGIATLDGYLGFYSTDYHNRFRKMIAPALDGNAWAKSYYDDWGARAYLFSGSGENVPSPFRTFQLEDRRLMIDTDAFKELGGTYVFSRIEISNDHDLGLTLIKKYEDTSLPYSLYIYQ